MNIALIIAYDGSPFLGWQKTSVGSSIEQTLEEFLQQILQEPIALQAASRTDRGVHAERQCVNFLTTKRVLPKDIMHRLNRLLPPSVRILEAHQMPLLFHPTLDAEKKEYHYQICMGDFQLPKNRFYSWHVPYLLDLSKMREASLFFLGTHDFSSFCNRRKNMNYKDKVRTIERLEIVETSSNRLLFKILGNHFLYKMIRNIVGTLVYVGQGKISLQELSLLFSTDARSKGGITAPAHGLTLKEIYYPQQFISKLY